MKDNSYCFKLFNIISEFKTYSEDIFSNSEDEISKWFLPEFFSYYLIKYNASEVIVKFGGVDFLSQLSNSLIIEITL